MPYRLFLGKKLLKKVVVLSVATRFSETFDYIWVFQSLMGKFFEIKIFA
jgi:hypothetical protein